MEKSKGTKDRVDDTPEAFSEYKLLTEQETDGDGTEKPAEADEDDDPEEKHHGVSLIAADQSAITGESLAVDKYLGDTCYYTTGCKRGGPTGDIETDVVLKLTYEANCFLV